MTTTSKPVSAKRAKKDAKGKKKRKKDPNAPKRPTTGFFSFCAEARRAAKSAHPDANVATLARVLGSQWNGMDVDERSPYMALAAVDRERYREEMAQYTPPRAAVKRVRSAYLFYCMGTRPALAAQFPNERVPEIGSRLGAGWQSLSPVDKEQYIAESANDKVRYVAECASRSAEC